MYLSHIEIRLVKKFSADDLYRHRVIHSIDASESGTAVFVVKKARRKSDDYSKRIWTVSTSDSSKAKPLTLEQHAAMSPKLGRNGRTLAFLSDRGNGMQVHLLDLSGGEARQATGSKHVSINSIECWSHDDRRLLVTASVVWREDGEDEPRDGSRGPEVVRHLPYKLDGTGITVGRRTHLFMADTETGELHALTDGDFDVKHGAWSGDSKRLAFVRSQGGCQRHRQELWIAAADGTGQSKLELNLASIASISWSPDGNCLAIVGAVEEGDSRARGWIVDTRSGDVETIGDIEIEPVGPLVWHKHGDRLALVAARRGLRELVVFSRTDANCVRLDAGLRHTLELVSGGDRLVYVAASMRTLCEMYSTAWDGGDERRHTCFNRKWVKRRSRPRVSKARYSVSDGNGGSEAVEAWLLRPDSDHGPFPLLVDFHGGPHSVTLIDFDAHTYWYDLCSRGWAVLSVNAVGSGSYGDEFARRIRGRWGELDLPQILDVVQQLQSRGLADDRIACTGKSYGGFLSAWAIGHSPIFRAAVVCAPVSNISSHAGTSDTGYYVTPFAMAADLNEDPALYRRLSPIGYCTNASATTLILQGENDGRCPRGQAEELFAHLVRCSPCTVEMVVYPGSTHAVAESGTPSHRHDYHQRLANWVDEHVDRQPSVAANV